MKLRKTPACRSTCGSSSGSRSGHSLLGCTGDAGEPGSADGANQLPAGRHDEHSDREDEEPGEADEHYDASDHDHGPESPPAGSHGGTADSVTVECQDDIISNRQLRLEGIHTRPAAELRNFQRSSSSCADVSLGATFGTDATSGASSGTIPRNPHATQRQLEGMELRLEGIPQDELEPPLGAMAGVPPRELPREPAGVPGEAQAAADDKVTRQEIASMLDDFAGKLNPIVEQILTAVKTLEASQATTAAAVDALGKSHERSIATLKEELRTITLKDREGAPTDTGGSYGRLSGSGAPAVDG